MPFNVLDEDLVSIRSIPDELPGKRGGKKVSHVTSTGGRPEAWRGVAPMETIWIGNALYSSREALRRFFERANRAKHDGRRPAPTATPTRADVAANARLVALGM